MIYFDHAATSFPKDRGMVKILAESSLMCGNPGRSGYSASMYASQKLYECREEAAGIFGTVPEKVILMPSCTAALNTAIKGLVKHGKTIMTNLEHNAVCRPLYALRNKGIIEVSEFDALHDPVADFERVSDGAASLVMTHASNVCGSILPVSEISERARKKGMTVIIDAAQSACHIPVGFDTVDADVICVAGHKGPGGPLGTGLMLLNPESEGVFDTLIEGGTGVYSLDEEMPDVIPERYEAGTLNAPAFASLAYSLKNTVITKADGTVFRYIRNALENMKGIITYLPPDDTECLPILLFNVEGMTPDDVMTRLAEKDICVRSGYHCAPNSHRTLGSVNGGVRISLGKNNTLREARTFIDELRKITKYA